MHSDRSMKGFTLFELMVTMAVAGIIVSYGVPGFFSIIQNNRATTHTNDLVTALNLGRSEATRRGVPVVVCSSSDGSTCNGVDGDWSGGWIVGLPGTPVDVLRVWPQQSGGDNVVTAADAAADDVTQVQFQARGSLTGTASTFTIELPGCTGDEQRKVSVNAAGRISVARATCE